MSVRIVYLAAVMVGSMVEQSINRRSEVMGQTYMLTSIGSTIGIESIIGENVQKWILSCAINT